MADQPHYGPRQLEGPFAGALQPVVAAQDQLDRGQFSGFGGNAESILGMASKFLAGYSQGKAAKFAREQSEQAQELQKRGEIFDRVINNPDVPREWKAQLSAAYGKLIQSKLTPAVKEASKHEGPAQSIFKAMGNVLEGMTGGSLKGKGTQIDKEAAGQFDKIASQIGISPDTSVSKGLETLSGQLTERLKTGKFTSIDEAMQDPQVQSISTKMELSGGKEGSSIAQRLLAGLPEKGSRAYAQSQLERDEAKRKTDTPPESRGDEGRLTGSRIRMYREAAGPQSVRDVNVRVDGKRASVIKVEGVSDSADGYYDANTKQRVRGKVEPDSPDRQATIRQNEKGEYGWVDQSTGQWTPATYEDGSPVKGPEKKQLRATMRDGKLQYVSVNVDTGKDDDGKVVEPFIKPRAVVGNPSQKEAAEYRRKKLALDSSWSADSARANETYRREIAAINGKLNSPTVKLSKEQYDNLFKAAEQRRNDAISEITGRYSALDAGLKVSYGIGESGVAPDATKKSPSTPPVTRQEKKAETKSVTSDFDNFIK